MNPVSASTLAILLSIVACSASKEFESKLTKDSFVLSGRMEFVDIETGCWVLVTEDGHRYEPYGEAAGPLWKDGLQVLVRVRPLAGVSSVCQVGTIVEVLTVLETKEI